MWQKLDQLRKKPKHAKDRYAFFGAVSFTAVIALIWVVAVGMRYSTETNIPAAVSSSNPAFSSLVSGFKKTVAEFRTGLQEQSATLETEVASEPKAVLAATSTELEPKSQSFSTSTLNASSSTSTPPKTKVVREVQIATSTRQSTTTE